MTGQQLKNSILQMAVSGKLVPQDPNDEPASVLLDRIRIEKEQLVKEGKIKKEKNPSRIFRGSDNLPYEQIGNNEPVCIADEVPFEIPESWEWCRLETICTKLVDGDHNPPKGEIGKTEYLMASSTNVNNDQLVELDKVRYLSRVVFEKENERTNATVGDIFFTSVGSLGRSCVYEGGLNICFQRSVSVMRTLIFNYYLKCFLDSGHFQEKIIREATGTAQKGFYLNQLAKSLIAIPPLAEQRRIVAKYKELQPFINEYTVKEQQTQELNETFPDQLRKSILQYAVQGKLVPQDPDDEPASVLLDCIRAEKEQLIAAGKIKRDKHESIIYRRDNSHYEKIDGVERCIDDEIPFEIPESWEWVRLIQICTSIADGDHQPPPQASTGIPFLVISNVSSGTIDFSNTRFVSEKYYASLQESRIPCRGDLLFTVTGSYGLIIPVETDRQFCFQRHIALLKFHEIDVDFLSAWLSSPLVYEQCNRGATGTAQKTVGLNTLKNLLIPMPPRQEQYRIMKRLQILMETVGKL